jgi:hypothetical protein
MPKLGEYKWMLDLPFFLYPTTEDARLGRGYGGTGFLVAIPYQNNASMGHIYGVTNAHVALGASRSGVLRFNTLNGGTDIFETQEEEWHSIPGLYDIAVLPINFLRPGVHRVEPIIISPSYPGSFYLGDEDIEAHDVNAGDDVFMVGRFIDNDGSVTNQPSLRFGNISILSANVHHPLGYTGRSVILDMRSRGGYSGSPVFIYRTHGSIFAREQSIVSGGHFMKLLGIHWWQYPERWEMREQSVVSPSGMTAIHPTSAIWDVLNLPELSEKRAALEAAIDR